MTNEKSNGPAILAAATAVPPHRIDQATIASVLRDWWGDAYEGSRKWKLIFAQVNRSLRIGGRNLALAPGAHPAAPESCAAATAAWARVAPELATEAARRALERAAVEPCDVSHVLMVTGTGIATPSIDARIINRLGINPRTRRTPMFGLGCAAGVAGIARATDYLRAFPGEIALVVSVELCSLTLQRNDLSIANVIASSLFGDGAAAVVIGSRNGHSQGPTVLATSSLLFPDTEKMMGWEVVPTGLKVVLSSAIPTLIRDQLARFLLTNSLASMGWSDLRSKHWIRLHTGGNRVLDAVRDALELEPDGLARSWRMLEENGNLSSASVLFVLNDLLESGDARPGDYGMMIAVGPGFGAELALL